MIEGEQMADSTARYSNIWKLSCPATVVDLIEASSGAVENAERLVSGESDSQ
jgi:hypothetical protein